MVRERLVSATAQQEVSACGRPLLGASVCLKPVTADEYSANSVNKDLNQKTNRALTILWLGLVCLEGSEWPIESRSKCAQSAGHDRGSQNLTTCLSLNKCFHVFYRTHSQARASHITTRTSHSGHKCYLLSYKAKYFQQDLFILLYLVKATFTCLSSTTYNEWNEYCC